MKRLALLVALAAALGFPHDGFAGAKKQPGVSVRIHGEGGQEGGNFSKPIQLLNGKRSTSLQEMPLASEHDIKAFFPFPAQDGSGTFGAYFRLDDHGTNLISQHTMSRRGSYLLVFVNGRRIVDLYIDKSVTDGLITVPTGLTANEVSLMEMTFPVIGQEHIKPSQKRKELQKALKESQKESAAAPLPDQMPRMAPAMTRDASGRLAPAQADYNSGPQISQAR